jgi:16S rRNA (uracil1498-N3)-methyltransferase
MPRLFYPSPVVTDGKITIADPERTHYLRDVLRLKAKDKVLIFDQKGNEYSSEVEKVSANSVSLRIVEMKSPASAKGIQLTIACAIPKKSKMSDIIDKLTQLGVDRIIPLNTQRVVVRLCREKETLLFWRWKKIVISASQQSQRNILPLVDPVTDIKELLTHCQEFDLRLIPTLSGERKPLKEVFSRGSPKNILVLIGPEGDFSEQEVWLAKKYGFIPVSLGDTVLRVDTAAIAVTSFIILTGGCQTEPLPRATKVSTARWRADRTR